MRMNEQDYKELLEHSYRVATESFECAPESRLEYLGDYIFDFTTYDGEMSVLFSRKAVEVCAAINNRLTFDHIAQKEKSWTSTTRFKRCSSAT